MKKNQKIIAAVVILCVLVVVVVLGLNGNMRVKTDSKDSYLEERNISEVLEAETYEKVDIEEKKADFDEVNSIYRGLDENGKVIGYAAFMTVNGYGGPMNVNVAMDEKAQKILNVRVGDNHEGEGTGKLIEENRFYEQFQNKMLPVRLKQEHDNVTLQDGSYQSKGKQDEEGYQPEVEVTIQDGEIKEVFWDEKKENGDSKRSQSIAGEYHLEQEGLRWHEQAEKLEQFIVEEQSVEGILLNQERKTDRLSSVTIKTDSFVSMVQDCIRQAQSGEQDNEVDGISGATVSSQAVINAANIAAEFISGSLSL